MIELTQRHSAAQQHQQHRGGSTGSSRSELEVVRIRLLGGFCLWAGPLRGEKVATRHTQITEITHLEGRVSHRWPAIGAERR
jgi:hypothetical protein